MKLWKLAIAAVLAAAVSLAQAPLVRRASMAEAKMVKRVEPPYPADALHLKVQGVVKIDIVIAADGRVESAHLVSGHPLLAPAALQAVRNWIYEPVLVDDAAVRVATRVSIPFALDLRGQPLHREPLPEIR